MMPEGWESLFAEEPGKLYVGQALQAVAAERKAGKQIYPAEDRVFWAFHCTKPTDVKVVIVGQDPYHGPGQAHGLAFSVPPGVRLPPSLRNILKEVSQDLSSASAEHGCLEAWARQGVLLLNTVLTVEEGKAHSHRACGWEGFTDAAISFLSANTSGVVFMLWGSAAQSKSTLIDSSRHLILTAAHPSPLSAYRGFFGCRHFSKANHYLEEQGKRPIDWALRR